MRSRLLSLIFLAASLARAQTGLNHFHIGGTIQYNPKDDVFIKEASTTLVLPAFNELMNGTLYIAAGLSTNSTAEFVGNVEYNR